MKHKLAKEEIPNLTFKDLEIGDFFTYYSNYNIVDGVYLKIDDHDNGVKAIDMEEYYTVYFEETDEVFKLKADVNEISYYPEINIKSLKVRR